MRRLRNVKNAPAAFSGKMSFVSTASRRSPPPATQAARRSKLPACGGESNRLARFTRGPPGRQRAGGHARSRRVGGLPARLFGVVEENHGPSLPDVSGATSLEGVHLRGPCVADEQEQREPTP